MAKNVIDMIAQTQVVRRARPDYLSDQNILGVTVGPGGAKLAMLNEAGDTIAIIELFTAEERPGWAMVSLVIDRAKQKGRVAIWHAEGDQIMEPERPDSAVFVAEVMPR